jgi:hypothetical protein
MQNTANSLIKIIVATLLIFLPINNTLVQFGVHRLGFTELVTFWKEGLIVLLLVVVEYRISSLLKLKPFTWASLWNTQYPQVLIGFLCVFGVLQSLGKVTAPMLVYGFRFELFWLCGLGVLWSWVNVEHLEVLQKWQEFIIKQVKVGAWLVVSVVILSVIFGVRFYEFLGYGTTGELLRISPIQSVIDGAGYNDGLRLSGGFPSPNHFAGYLLLVVGLTLTTIKKNRDVILPILLTLCIIGSFARFAWLGLLFYVLAFWATKHTSYLANIRKYFYAIPVVLALIGVFLPGLAKQLTLPSVIAKPSSSELHYNHTMSSLKIISSTPGLWLDGYGLGVSGPASTNGNFALQDNPIFKKYLELKMDVPFYGESHVSIPESWLLQVLLNGGVWYALLYCGILVNALSKLNSQYWLSAGAFGVLLGNLILHIWENQTVAWYFVLILIYGISQSKLITQSTHNI